MKTLRLTPCGCHNGASETIRHDLKDRILLYSQGITTLFEMYYSIGMSISFNYDMEIVLVKSENNSICCNTMPVLLTVPATSYAYKYGTTKATINIPPT